MGNIATRSRMAFAASTHLQEHEESTEMVGTSFAISRRLSESVVSPRSSRLGTDWKLCAV